METGGQINIIDKTGWIRQYNLAKSITRIGSHPGNDLVLDNSRGSGVGAWHAQIIRWSEPEPGYRLVNLAPVPIPTGEQDRVVAPRSSIDLADGATFRLGEFTLIFNSSALLGGTAVSKNKNIELRLALPEARLRANETLEGALLLRNLGSQDRVQFELDLEGLPPTCYRIEPAPLLFTGAEGQVRLQIFHHGFDPAAGEHPITVCAAAPQAYPNETAVITRSLQVEAFYSHQLRIFVPQPAPPLAPVETQVETRDFATLPIAPIPTPIPAPAQVLSASSEQPAPVQATPPSREQPAPEAPAPEGDDWEIIPEPAPPLPDRPALPVPAEPAPAVESLTPANSEPLPPPATPDDDWWTLPPLPTADRLVEPAEEDAWWLPPSEQSTASTAEIDEDWDAGLPAPAPRPPGPEKIKPGKVKVVKARVEGEAPAPQPSPTEDWWTNEAGAQPEDVED